MKPLDLRVERTYTLLTNALLSLLKEKTFDQITVGELCKIAMIRRATFYNHFGDKYDLYSFAIRTLQEKFKSSNPSIVTNQNTKDFFLTMLDSCIAFIEQHPYIIQSLMDSKSAQLLFDILSNEIEQDILFHLDQKPKITRSPIDYPELAASMMTGAMVSTIKWWISTTEPISREELLKLYSQIAFGYIDNLDA